MGFTLHIINLYSFDELSEKAKQYSLDKYRSINVEHDWWDSTYDDAKQIGLKLETFDLDGNKHCKGNFILSANEVAQNVFNNHRESCDTYKTAQSFMQEWQPIFVKYMQTEEGEDLLMEIEERFLEKLLKDYANLLQEECNYLQSDECIIETFESNDYTFEESGKMNNG